MLEMLIVQTGWSNGFLNMCYIIILIASITTSIVFFKFVIKMEYKLKNYKENEREKFEKQFHIAMDILGMLGIFLTGFSFYYGKENILYFVAIYIFMVSLVSSCYYAKIKMDMEKNTSTYGLDHDQ